MSESESHGVVKPCQEKKGLKPSAQTTKNAALWPSYRSRPCCAHSHCRLYGKDFLHQWVPAKIHDVFATCCESNAMSKRGWIFSVSSIRIACMMIHMIFNRMIVDLLALRCFLCLFRSSQRAPECQVRQISRMGPEQRGYCHHRYLRPRPGRPWWSCLCRGEPAEHGYLLPTLLKKVWH